MSRTLRTAVLSLTLAVSGFGVAFGVVQLPNPSAAVPAPALAPVEWNRIDAIPAVQPLAPPAPVEVVDPADDEFLAELLGTHTDLPPARATELIDGAHMICEGLTAGVPAEGMRDHFMVTLDLADEEARALLGAAVAVYCPTMG